MQTICKILGITALCGMMMAGCGQPTSTRQTNRTNVTPAGPSAHQPTSTNTTANLKNAAVSLKGTAAHPKLSGAASLTLNDKTHQLTIALELNGMQPKGTYTEAIATAGGQVLHDLKPIQPDKTGSGASLTTVSPVEALDVSWVINVYSGKSVAASGHMRLSKS